MTVVIAGVSAGVLGLLLSSLLIFASKVFHVHIDERIEKITDMLPGANCGACGYAGCGQMAEAMVKGEIAVDGCPVAGPDAAEEIANVLGQEAPAEKEKTRAYVFCQGSMDVAKEDARYVGAQTCATAHLTGGSKNCAYGCLGFGDCVSVCTFSAIIMGEDGLPKVIENKCTSCGKCVSACPRGIIEIHPVSQPIHIYCRSHDRGPVSKKACSKACTACNLCVKNSEEGAVTIENNLAVVNYDAYALNEASYTKCPTKAITADAVNVIK